AQAEAGRRFDLPAGESRRSIPAPGAGQAFRQGRDQHMSAVALDLEHLRTWIGRTETRTDLATAAPYAALSATLDREDAEPETGTVVPPLWHWLYFLPLAPIIDVGPDGHPKRGGFLPPVPLP